MKRRAPKEKHSMIPIVFIIFETYRGCIHGAALSE